MKIIKIRPQKEIRNCRTKRGCEKTSWEDMTGRTFETAPYKKAA